MDPHASDPSLQVHGIGIIETRSFAGDFQFKWKLN